MMGYFILGIIIGAIGAIVVTKAFVPYVIEQLPGELEKRIFETEQKNKALQNIVEATRECPQCKIKLHIIDLSIGDSVIIKQGNSYEEKELG